MNAAGDTKIDATATGRIIPPSGTVTPQTGVDGKTVVGGPNAATTNAAGAATNASGQPVVGQNVNAELRGAGGQNAAAPGGVTAGGDLTTVEEAGHDGNAAKLLLLV